MVKITVKALALALTFNLALAVSGAWAAQPLQVVKSVIENALNTLNNTSIPESQRRSVVKAMVDRHFDYQEMAKRSLGNTWRTLSRGQQDEFVRLFAQLLEASYSDKIEKYAKRVKIDYVGESVDGNYAEVRTVVVRPNDRIPLSYRLLNEDGTWKVYDVTIEGVSLVSNYRSQFRRIISESSYASLVQRLRNKVQTLRVSGGA